MTPLVASPAAKALALALVHFAWQGSVIGLGAWLCLRLVRLSANARYSVGILMLAAMLAAPVATFVRLVAASPDTAARDAHANVVADMGRPTAGESTIVVTPTPSSDGAPSTDGTPLLSFVLGAWLIGVGAFSMRLLGGWIVARRWARQAMQPVPPEILFMARRMADRLAVAPVARVYESAAATVPMVMGWARPVILVPAAAIGGLAPAHLEAILAHELAHVRRHDYVVNLLQSVVETLLFYHPAVWWVSREVRQAREQCCDDLAIEACGNRIVYASALTELATMMKPRLALAATDGSLGARVRRILGERERSRASALWVPALLALFFCAALVPAGAGPAPVPSVDVVSPQTPDAAAVQEKEAAAARERAQKLADEARQKAADAQKQQLALFKQLDEQKAQDVRKFAEQAAQWKGVAEAEWLKYQDEAARKMLDAQRERFDETKAAQLENEAKLQDEKRETEAKMQALQRELDSRFQEKAQAYSQLVLAQQIQDVEAKLAVLRQKFSENHPDVRAVEAQVVKLKAQLELATAQAALSGSGATGVLQPGSVINVTLQYRTTRSTVPNVQINPDGTTDDLVFGLVFGPVKIGGLTMDQAMTTLSAALRSRQESLAADQRVGAVSITISRVPAR